MHLYGCAPKMVLARTHSRDEQPQGSVIVVFHGEYEFAILFCDADSVHGSLHNEI